jgi:hypothetical protein
MKTEIDKFVLRVGDLPTEDDNAPETLKQVILEARQLVHDYYVGQDEEEEL